MKYKIILCDVPWSYQDKGCNGSIGNCARPYNTLSIKDLCALPIKDIADKDCVLFFWATYPMMEGAIEIIKDWGFEYKSIAFQWIKLNKKNGKPFYGLGRWCVGENTQVCVCHKDTGLVSFVTVKRLFELGFYNYDIFTPTGFKRLNEVIPNGIKKTLSIKHMLGETFCTENHRWAIKKVSRPRKEKGSKLREIKHITTFATCTEILKLKELAVYKNGISSLGLLFSHHTIESSKVINNFKDFDLNYDIGWLIGLYCAEGYLSGKYKRHIKFCLGSHEDNLFKKIEVIVNSLSLMKDRYFNHPVYVNKFICKDKKAMYIYMTSGALAELISNFIKGSSAKSKFLNLDAILQTPIIFREGFIRGYLEGDGTKVSNRYTCGRGWKGFNSVSTASKNLSEGISQVLFSLGVMHTTDILSTKPTKLVKKEGVCYKTRFLYPTNTKLRFQDKPVTLVSIKDMKESFEMPTYDLSVEGEVFWADGLISHNTRGNTEPLLLAVKGKPKRIAKDVFQLIQSPIRGHSSKPPEARQQIVKLMGDLPRIEIFARERVEGWDAIGFDLDGKDIKDSLKEVIEKV